MARLYCSYRYLQKGYILPVICFGFTVGCLLVFSYNGIFTSDIIIKGNDVVEGTVSKAVEVVTTTTTAKTATAESSTITYSWFRPAHLLQLEENLKAEGWQVPKGNLGRHIQLMKIKGSKTTTTIAPKDILAVADRWKIAHIGHFKQATMLPLFANRGPPTHQKTTGECITKCQSFGKLWSSFNKRESTCKCGDSLSISMIKMLVAEKAVDYEDVYRVAKFTKDDVITLDSVKQISAGCFEKPADFDKMFPGEVNDPNYDVARCLLYCEKDLYPIAAWDGVRRCQCGKFDENFPQNRMGTPVDDKLCNKSPCLSDPEACTSKYVRIMRTNSRDDRCEMKKFLPRGIGRRVALISFPGSGNTWVRYLIESATGIYSGCVYNDQDLYQKGFLGELLKWNSLQTSVIKTHQFEEQNVRNFEAAIFIVRNPYNAILAEFNRIRGGHVGYAEEELFGTMEWVYFVSYKMPKWIRSIENYLKMDKILLIYFEHIVENPMREVRKMVDFLNYPVENLERRLACLEANLNGSFKRPKRILSFDPYHQQSKDTVNSYIRTAKEIISQRGLSPMPDYEK